MQNGPAGTPRDSKFPLPPRPMLVQVTPEMAVDWLDNRHGSDGPNIRNLSRAVSGRYADAMRRGEWKENHQGIAFDTGGWLLDGKHRLQAVANSGVVVGLWVFPDMPRDVFDTLDVGRRRLASHLITAPNATVLASAVRFLAVADGIHDPRTITEAYANLSNVETLELIRRGGYKLEQATRIGVRLRRGAKLPPSPAAAVAYQALHTEATEGDLEDFVEGLVTGADLSRDDPRLRLRQAFNATAASRAAAMRTPSHPYALIVKAWNAHLTRRSISQLVWRGDEEVPRVIGYTPTLRDENPKE